MDDALLTPLVEVFALVPFWGLMYSANRGRMIGVQWPISRLAAERRRQLLVAGLLGTSLLLCGFLIGDLLPLSWVLIVLGVVWMACITVYLVWAIMFDPSRPPPPVERIEVGHSVDADETRE